MTLGMLCLRRTAIVAALVGGFLIAVLSAGLCAQAVVMGGHAGANAIRSVAGFFGF